MIKNTQKENKQLLYTPVIILITLHLLFSNYTSDAYSLDRVLVYIILFSFFIFYSTLQKQINIRNPFLAIFAFGLIQAFTSSYIDTEFELSQQILISLSAVLFIVAYALYDRTQSSLALYLNTILVSNAILTAGIILFFFYHETTLIDTIKEMFSNIRVYNHIQTISIPSLSLLLFTSKNTHTKIATKVLLFSNIFFALETGARGTMFSIILSFFLLFITNYTNNKIKTHLRELLFVSFIALLSYIVYFLTGDGSNFSHLSDTSSNGRMHIAHVLSEYITNTDYLLSAIGFSSQNLAVYGFLHPHNMIAYVFLGTGITGASIFTISIFIYAFRYIKRYFSFRSSTKKYLLVILSSVFIHSMVSGIYMTPIFSLLFFYFLLSFNSIYLQVNTKTDRKKINILLNIIIIASLLVPIAKLTKESFQYKAIFLEMPPKEDDKIIMNLGIFLYRNTIFTTKKDNNDTAGI